MVLQGDSGLSQRVVLPAQWHQQLKFACGVFLVQ